MINDENVWNFIVNKNYYEIFPLASIFDPPILNVPLKLKIGGSNMDARG